MHSSRSSRSHSRPVTSSNEDGIKKRGFVFGSSTPRELSHMAAVSRRHRLIHTRKDSALEEEAPPVLDVNSEPKRDILYYMRKARSVTPATARSLHQHQLNKHSPNNWAFGSSTPRELSHLEKMKPEQRVYDAKLNCGGAGKSMTTSAIATDNQWNHLSSGGRPAISDAASEPDIVQDRGHFSVSQWKKNGGGKERSSTSSSRHPASGNEKNAKSPTAPGTAIDVEASKRKKEKKRVTKDEHTIGAEESKSKDATRKDKAEAESSHRVGKEVGQESKLRSSPEDNAHGTTTDTRRPVKVTETKQEASNEKTTRVLPVRPNNDADASSVLFDDEHISKVNSTTTKSTINNSQSSSSPPRTLSPLVEASASNTPRTQ